LACCRYVEWNPVRAGIVAAPSEYPWSSHGQHTGEVDSYPWLDVDPCFEALAVTEVERRVRYRDFVSSAIPTGEWSVIREALQRGQLTGHSRFVDEVEAIVGRRIEHRKQGRPRKYENGVGLLFYPPIRLFWPPRRCNFGASAHHGLDIILKLA